MYAILLWNMMMRMQKVSPMRVDCTTDTTVANLAALPFPAPSSFATLTLSISRENYIKMFFFFFEIKIGATD